LQTKLFQELAKPRFHYHHYRISNHKIWYGYSCNEKPIVGGIRFLCETVEETLSLIKSFNGDGWVITTFLIDYEGDDGIIIDSRFKQYSL
jgi:hypothetical protein